MKKLIAGVFLLVFIFVVLFFGLKKSDTQEKVLSPISQTSIASITPEFLHSNLLFVPYWGIGKNAIESKSYDGLIYFGVRPDANGIDIQDDGYKKIPEFIDKSDPKTKKFLAIRLLDSSINFKVLENKNVQKKVIAEAITLAKQYSFQGIVLDLEVSSLPFDSVVKEINSFTNDFYMESKTNDLSFYTILYGDVFYRVRTHSFVFFRSK